MLNNLSLTVKSSFSFALLAIIGIGVGLISYLQADAARDTVNERLVLERQVAGMAHLKLEILDQAMALKAFLLTGDLDWSEHVQEDVDKLEDQFKTLAGVEGISDIKASWKSWYTQFADHQMKLMRDPMSVDLARAIEVSGVSSDKLKIILDDMDSKIDAANSVMADLTARQNGMLANVTSFALLGLIALVGAALLLAFFNHVIASRPLVQMVGVTEKLAAGDLSIDIAENGRRDEIGKMYQALTIFRDNLLHTKKLELQSEEERVKAAELKKTEMNNLADQFDSTVGSIVSTVATASNELNTTARSMTEISNETNHQATSASSASEQTSGNVQTVASATEEMTSTVAEISEQVVQASNSIREAVGKVEKTNSQMTMLTDTASKIGEVVGLISTIAEQTNLLALNATIESARAGEAGKGFAVVAGEVKELAGQTAKATDEISQQIHDIQQATNEASTSMGDVSEVIRSVDEIATAIAAAMEEQNAATHEIAGNIHQAAQGTQLVNSNVLAVAKSSKDTGAASGKVMTAASELASQSSQLRDEVDKFIAQVRAG